MVLRRFPSSEASAPVVMLKLVMRSFSDSSFLSSAAATFPKEATSLERSRGWVPCEASLTIDVFFSAPGL